MVTTGKLSSCRVAMTIVEVVVTSVLLGVIFTGMMATTTMTMRRITTSAQKENDEKQLDRFQVEMTHFVSRSSKVEILDANNSPAAEGNTLVCTLQPDPIEKTPITLVVFKLKNSEHNPAKKTLSTKIKVEEENSTYFEYTYSTVLEPPPDGSMFKWNNGGFVEYRWNLDSGQGVESFNNMVAPPSSL